MPTMNSALRATWRVSPARAISKSTTFRSPTCHRLRQISCTSQSRTQRPTRLDPSQVLNPFNPQAKQTAANNDLKRVRLLAFAAVTCMVLTFGIVQYSDLPNPEQKNDASSTKQAKALKADAPKPDQDTFQGKPIVVAPGGAKVLAQDERTGEEVELVETGTSSVPHFPKTIDLPSADEKSSSGTSEYTLIGLGIRTVSFLGIQVYVMGLYVQTSDLAALQSKFIKKINPLASSLIPHEKATLKERLLDPEQSYQFWDEVLRESLGEVNSAFRIVPTRGTDFQHLRDGWVRGITTKTQDAGRRGDTEFSDETFALTMKSFNALFGGKGKAPKGSSVILTRDADGRLGVLFQDKTKRPEVIGSLGDERVTRLIWLNYLGGKNVSSEDARRKIVDGIVELVERPIGSVATMVT